MYDASDKAINDELKLNDWIDELLVYEPANENKGILVFDAFDAARDETLRMGILAQIKKAKKLLAEKWNIIVSARTYDASKSPELIRLFPVKAPKNTILLSRSTEIDLLQDNDIQAALSNNAPLLEFFNTAHGRLKEILRIPFFLLLLEGIIQEFSQAELADIKKYKSETELLKLYWQKKIIDTSLQIDNEQLLSKLTNFMVEHRTLNCPKELFFREFSALNRKAFTWLRSENILDEVSVNESRIAFSHNILFDYAVSRFCLFESYTELVSFIGYDRSRPFFLRPSFIYFFTSLWYSDSPSFWNLYNSLSKTGTKEIKLLVRLILNGVIASEYSAVQQLKPLFDDGDETTRTINLKNLFQSIRFIRSKTFPQDFALLLEISTRLQISFLFEFAFLLQRSLGELTDGDKRNICGQTARNFFSFILEARTSGDKFFVDRIGAG